MNIHIQNSYKLVTKEDPIHIHKLLGGICLAHYIYRYYLLLTTGTMSLHTPVAYYMVGIHGLLSCSSMMFHIPNQRIKGRPMIYPEYRLHSIVFALRSIACYYLTYHGFHKIYNIGICFATMGCADIITYMYPSGTTTMRQMPFETGVDMTKRTHVIITQSFHQIGATFYMLGNEDACFSPMFAIQLAAFLMTLVRKSIISTNTWHIIYNVSLGCNIFVYWSLSIQYIFLQLGLAHLFFYWRFYLSRETLTHSNTTDTGNSPTNLRMSLSNTTHVYIKNITGNKYIGWTIVFGIYLLFENKEFFTFYYSDAIRVMLIVGYCVNNLNILILPLMCKT